MSRNARRVARPRPAKDTLVEYRRKRDFTLTDEPAGVAERSTREDRGTLAFVIQKHHASHLHFDLRLEVDGTMKSWAVPKGPSRDPAVKRLAMQVEDHPIAYNSFEGTIPKGEYGGGTVMIWDRGTYTSPQGDENAIRAALAKGRLKFTLHGERLRGTWNLVRTGRERQWLLIKHSDEHDERGDILASQDVGSIVSGRTMSEIADRSAPVSQPAGKDMPKKPGRRSQATVAHAVAAHPTLLPMLASAAKEIPNGDGWVFEPKYDGVRVLAFVSGDAVALISRNAIDKAAQFPEVMSALRALSRRRRRAFVLDGEIVPRKGKALGRFQDLQQRIGQMNATTIASQATDAPVTLVAFDLLLDGPEPLAPEPWTTRRKHLESLLKGQLEPGLMLGEVELRDVESLLARARDCGWEGVMAKRSDAPYTPGERTKAWRKLKIEGRQELVVGGWTEPRGSRQNLGALLLGFWDGDDFVYAGRVGTGFSDKSLGHLYAKLRKLERSTSPFAKAPKRTTEAVHWTKPELVVEVKFNEWTAGGQLRQPVFLGVRDDKDARSVVRESQSMPEPDARPAPRKRSASKSGKTTSIEGVADALLEIENGSGNGVVDIPGAGSLKVTNLSKTYFPRAQCTKGDLMRYYDQVSPTLLPLIDGRPLVLKRYPNGVDAKPFFQQNAPDDAPASLRVGTVPSESTPGRRIIGGDLYTLLYCVQLGAIDVNPWHSRIGSLEYADYTILDLDPGPKASFATVIQVARTLKDLLDAAGLVAAVKTSGSRGLHIVVPLPPETNHEAALLVAEILANQAASERPKEATVIRSRNARPPGAVYVDYMQNILGKSVASAFSVRPRAEAMVSTPIEWSEVTARLKPERFSMDIVLDELPARARIWNSAMSAKNRLDTIG